eukprot:scpid43739/ scgid1192/ LINE-1 reverse transcriptase homolog
MTSKLLRVAMWNVRSCSSNLQREQLASSLKARSVDVCAVQETKIIDECTWSLPFGYKLLSFPTINRYGGLGLAIGPRLLPHLSRWRAVSDRLGYALFSFPSPNKNSMAYISAYAPTLPTSEKTPAVRQEFYDSLLTLIRSFAKRTLVLVGGDFNAKVGRRHASDAYTCLGRWANGRRNSNGEALLESCEETGMRLANTTFQHPARHITTWTGTIRRNQQNVNIYNQIDYVLIPDKICHGLQDSRAYAGCELASDHKMVVTTMVEPSRAISSHYCSKQKEGRIPIEKLSTNSSLQQVYRDSISHAISSLDSGVTWEKLAETIKCSAEAVLGKDTRGRQSSSYVTDDPTISDLSTRQKQLRIQINATPNVEEKTALKTQRNRLLHRLSAAVKQCEVDRLEAKAVEIECIKNDTSKMHASVAALCRPRRSGIAVDDGNGARICNPAQQARRVSDHFCGQFSDSSSKPLKKETTTLTNNITTAEVASAIRRLKNGKSPGPDGIPNEMLKYACNEPLCTSIAHILQTSVESATPDSAIGAGVLIPLQKPGKPKGPCSSLRPIVLLNSVRKILSSITLRRIQHQVEQYLPSSQSAYRPGRSTSDIVFTLRILSSLVENKQWSFNKLGIDLSKAFDTPHRNSLLESILTAAPGVPDARAMVSTLLVDTTLSVRVCGQTADAFQSGIGTPQGDCLSPVLFTCYFEHVLQQLRHQFLRETAGFAPSSLMLILSLAMMIK